MNKLHKVKKLSEVTISGVPHLDHNEVANNIVTELVNGTMSVEDKNRPEYVKAMKDTNSTLDKIEELRKEILKKRSDYIDTEKQITETAKNSSANLRKTTETLNQAFIKFSKVSDLGRIETQAKQIVDIADALEKICKLEESGALGRLAKMLGGKQ